MGVLHSNVGRCCFILLTFIIFWFALLFLLFLSLSLCLSLLQQSDISRPSLSFLDVRESGHPEDLSVVITMGSQFDKQKPRFLPSTALRRQLAALTQEDDNGNSLAGDSAKSSLSPAKRKTSSLAAKGAIKTVAKRRGSRMSPLTNRKSPTTRAKGGRPSTTVTRGSSSLGKLAQTV